MSENGYFEAYINSKVVGRTVADGQLLERITQTTHVLHPSATVRWAGSQRKGTDIAGSDFDLCVSTTAPFTAAQRKELAADLHRILARSVTVRSHVIRLMPERGFVKVDISFENAVFGNRQLADPAPFDARASRRFVVRALKLWTQSNSLPRLPGWTVEALVMKLDASPAKVLPLELFDRVIEWFALKATPGNVEAILRPAAASGWSAEWSRQLPGQLTAISNAAKSLIRHQSERKSWRSSADVGRWLCR